MGIWDWLFGSRKKEGMYIKGVKIPAAYTPLAKWLAGNPGKNPSNIRFFEGNKKFPFVFDNENAVYKTFDVRCREDTKKLGKAILQGLEERNLPLLGSSKKFPSSKKNNFLRLSALIRTPYFSSEEEKWDRWKGDGLAFVLHFDENHLFHLARVYIHGKDNSNISLLKNNAVYILNTEKDMLTYSYGNWAEMARVLLDAIERNKIYLRYLQEM
ncbi:MAG: hypothetical protein Q8R18_03330 [bacterium]|nr:hypothetical protein [bacterium]